MKGLRRKKEKRQIKGVSKDYAVTVLHTSQITIGHTKSS
jgi:hypothetical protein